MSPKKVLSQEPGKFWGQNLLNWFEHNSRDFPWRQRRDVYSTWIVEIMSQQTTLPVVLPYFERWMQRFPNVHHLARAAEHQVMSAWQGLGYYSRARNLLRSAQELSLRLKKNNRWPDTEEQWCTLPGVGPYTARSILSMAQSQPVLPVDGNVIRVLSRILGVEDPLNQPRELKAIYENVSELEIELTERNINHGDFAEALMDLGSSLCRPQCKARCELCPLRSHCWAFKNNCVAAVPRAKRRKQLTPVTVLAFGFEKKPGVWALRQIPEGRRLASQWEFPLWELDEKWLKKQLRSDSDGLIKSLKSAGVQVSTPIKHNITNYNYKVYFVFVESESVLGENLATHIRTLSRPYQWVSLQRPGSKVLTTLTRKLMKKC